MKNTTPVQKFFLLLSWNLMIAARHLQWQKGSRFRVSPHLHLLPCSSFHPPQTQRCFLSCRSHHLEGASTCTLPGTWRKGGIRARFTCIKSLIVSGTNKNSKTKKRNNKWRIQLQVTRSFWSGYPLILCLLFILYIHLNCRYKGERC